MRRLRRRNGRDLEPQEVEFETRRYCERREPRSIQQTFMMKRRQRLNTMQFWVVLIIFRSVRMTDVTSEPNVTSSQRKYHLTRWLKR